MSRRLTQRGKQRRSQLMELAALRFAEQGYHPTSVAEIVEATGVGKGVFYWYFSSKEELFQEILRDLQFSLRKSQQAQIGDEPDPVRRLELGIAASMHWLNDHRHYFNLLSFAATETAFSGALKQGQELAVQDAMRHVKEGMAEGRIASGDPLLVTTAVIGVTNALARRFLFERHDDPDDVAAAATAFALNGLLGPIERSPSSFEQRSADR